MGPQSGHEQDNHDRYWGERWISTAPIGPDCVHIVPNPQPSDNKDCLMDASGLRGYHIALRGMPTC